MSRLHSLAIPLSLFVVLSGAILSGCAIDKLQPKVVNCVTTAYQGENNDWYGGFAVNTSKGLIVVSRRNHVDVWRGCGEGRQALRTETFVADKLQISTSGRYLLASRYMGTPVEIFDLNGPSAPIRLQDCYAEAVLSPREDVAIAQCHDGIRVVDLISGKFVGAPFKINPSAFSMTVNRSFDRLVIGTASGTLALIAIEKTDAGYSLRRIVTWDTYYGVGEWITPVTFSDNEKEIISVGRRGQLDVWDANSGTLLRHWQTDLTWVGTATFARDRRFIAIFGVQVIGEVGRNRVVIVDTKTGERVSKATPSNYQYATYLKDLDRLLVAGPSTPPYLMELPEER